MDGLIALALAKKYTDKVGQDIISAGFKVQVEDNRSILNRQGEEKVLYLLPKEYGSSQDGYDEFVYANYNWEWIGKTDVSLDYELLSNKPTLTSYNSPTPKTLAGNVNFSSSFGFSDYTEGENITIDLRRVYYDQLDHNQNYMYGFQIPGDQYFTAYYNFNNLHDRSLAGEMDYTNAGFFRGIGKNLVNTPVEFSDSIGEMSRVTIIHYSTQPANEPLSNRYYLLRVIYFQDTNTNKIRQFVQWIYFPSLQNTTVTPITDWQEIGGGAQIVSGVVNSNGTITFTDSEGNSFTTSGSNLVTSGNEQISMGYDEGGFYFLFDDGQEEVNNGAD